MKIKFFAASLCLLMPLVGNATGIPCAGCSIGEVHGAGTPVIDINAATNAKALQELQIKQLDELNKIQLTIEVNNSLLKQLIALKEQEQLAKSK